MSKDLDLNIIKYKLLTLNNVKEAVNLHIETSLQECLTIGFGLADEPDKIDKNGFTALLTNIIEDGVSIGAFDITTNELVGVCFNKLHTKSERDSTTSLEDNVDENMKDAATRDLMRFIFELESSVDIYENYGIDLALELFYIGVDSRYRRYGIAKNLVKATIDMINNTPLKSKPEILYGVFTSNYSQSLAKKFNFETLHTVYYTNYLRFDGKKLSEKIGNVHQTVKLAALQL